MTQRTRFTRPGMMAIQPKAWGLELAERGGEADRGFTEEGDAAIVDIRGPLIHRADSFWGLFCDSYDAIRTRVAAALESSAARVILRIDSPGGDGAGCFELARELRAMAAAAGKPLIAYAEGLCCSAAYAIASAANVIGLAPTAYAGSIGVFEARVDWTAQTAAMGLKVVIISSGEEKTDRNPDVPVTDEAIARIREQVDQFAELFFELVAEMRGGTPDQYRALQGGVRLGQAACGAGLADHVWAWGDLIAGKTGSGDSAMPSKAMTYDEALDAMKKCAEGDDEDAKKAKNALKAVEDADKPEDEKKDEGKAKSEGGDGEDKEKKDKEAKAKAEEEKKKDDEAKALAAGGPVAMALARELQELKAKDAARDAAEAKAKDDAKRAELLATRPDFSEAQKKTLAAVDLTTLEDACKSWPRVTALPGSSTSALTPTLRADAARGGYQPQLDEKEQKILAGLDAKPTSGKAALRKGTATQMPGIMSREDAAKRAEELEAELKEMV